MKTVIIFRTGYRWKIGLDWTCKLWTGLVKHELVKHGLVKHGLVKDFSKTHS